ncbi:MAG: outer membrane lipoprotein carrier protein LolA [Phycisphaeraceae bacterium]
MTNPDQDLIDMIAKATPDTTVNEDHRDALRRQVLEAYDQRETDTEHEHKPLFTFTGVTVMKFAASLALLTAIGVFAMTTMTPSKAIAFEDVATAILAINNASYETHTVVYQDGEQPEIEDPYTVYMQFPQRVRVELPMDIVAIADVPADKLLFLNAELKEAFLIDGLSNFTDDQKPTNLIAEIQDHFRKAQKNEALGKVKYTKLGQKLIKGQQAIGYRVHDPEDQDFDTADIWSDAKTALPIQIDYIAVIDETTKVISTLKNFKYDQDFDADLFSLTPPKDYKLSKANDIIDQLDETLDQLDKAIDKFNGAEPGIEDLALAMALYAAETDGNLPDQLLSGLMIDAMTDAWEKANPDKPLFKGDGIEMTDEHLNAAIESVFTAYDFLESLTKQDIAYTYAGNGVEIGSEDQPVFWYKPKGADKYKVIDADMTIRESDRQPQQR